MLRTFLVQSNFYLQTPRQVDANKTRPSYNLLLADTSDKQTPMLAAYEEYKSQVCSLKTPITVYQNQYSCHCLSHLFYDLSWEKCS